MNVVKPLSEIEINVVPRGYTPGEITTEWILILTDKQTNKAVILANPGRETNVVVTQADPDDFMTVHFYLAAPLVARRFYSLYLYAINSSVSRELETLLDSLELSPTGDAFLSLKAAIDLCSAPPTFALVYRGVLFCTDEDITFPYSPLEGHYDVIEKPKREYKTR